MDDYPFELIDGDTEEQIDGEQALLNRPVSGIGFSFAEDAKRFVAGRELDTAINTAIAVGEPLLLTGEPGTGKTQAAYYAAYKLKLEPVIHFQVKSDTAAGDLLYDFDAVRYFHDANIRKDGGTNKSRYIERRALWDAIKSDRPRVLLIDEIDKAPRDFPNDLLHELDKMEFTVAETGEEVSGTPEKRPVVFITSNSERRLPEPFLRRCVYHHIPFDRDLVMKAVMKRRDEYPDLGEPFLKLAVERFLTLRETALRKYPSTSELLVWLRVLGLSPARYTRELDHDLSKLPYLGVLIKDHQDLEDLKRR